MSDEGFTIEWPMWGMRLEGRAAGLAHAIKVGGGLLYRPTWVEWARMELSDIRDEYFGQHLRAEQLEMNTQAQPPVCLARFSTVDSAGDPSPTFADQTDIARNLLDALRLHAAGDFIDPTETCTYMELPSGLPMRAVSVFRSSFYHYIFDNPYRLSVDDAEPLDALTSQIRALRAGLGHTNAILAIENFRLSFGSAVGPAERCLHRFIAIEALLGPTSKNEAGASFTTRAANATGGTVPDVLAWLESAGGLRDGLAHALIDVVPSEDDLAMLENVTRAVLVSYLAHVSADGAANPIRSFNRALAAGPIVGARWPRS
jgi:hypothetical protein